MGVEGAYVELDLVRPARASRTEPSTRAKNVSSGSIEQKQLLYIQRPIITSFDMTAGRAAFSRRLGQVAIGRLVTGRALKWSAASIGYIRSAFLSSQTILDYTNVAFQTACANGARILYQRSTIGCPERNLLGVSLRFTR